MAKQNKQPVVYVVRELTVDGVDDLYSVIGWFVSKAYLTKTMIEYTEEGDKYYGHTVDFNIGPAIFAIDNNVDIHAENGDKASKSELFKDYKSCKEYAMRLNKLRLERLTKGKSEYDCEVIKKKFSEAMKYAKYLEEKYLSVEEREKANESTNNY